MVHVHLRFCVSVYFITHLDEENRNQFFSQMPPAIVRPVGGAQLAGMRGSEALAPAGKRQRGEEGEVLHAETERACLRRALRVAEPAGGKRKRSVSLAAGGSKSAKTL